jgi:hypothetical protein
MSHAGPGRGCPLEAALRSCWSCLSGRQVSFGTCSSWQLVLCVGVMLGRLRAGLNMAFPNRRFDLEQILATLTFRFLLATPRVLRCCFWVPVRDLGARIFGQGGGQVLEEVLAGPSQDGLQASGARLGGPLRVVRPVARYGPPPSSLPLPMFATSHGRPSTSRHARSLLEGRLVDRPDVDGQALQLALGELSHAMRRAEV